MTCIKSSAGAGGVPPGRGPGRRRGRAPPEVRSPPARIARPGARPAPTPGAPRRTARRRAARIRRGPRSPRPR
ncbi:hypothetical protein DOU09_14130 [Clavibacter michiganensis subsp. michiganensis]|nr:hypothetical protein [Clavibacter michiganensis subsp. michiganensis]MWJ04519.1 hypothetical protein [Clavibacter michiganensis subsp. michiganensis]MWJ10936.1 hypothetical protein [Clavibacter michiganensis subsp. michiganensis]MWJ14067.1 hypothetical protein [Clavibacter michiganensis subsp. michiganensis]MWJ22891.1 hypothetical protein [Clavibacter michiganensis subsp. michiganensis]